MIDHTYENASKDRDNKMLAYFKSLELSEFQMKEVIKKLRYEFHSAGTKIFQYQDIGDKFYLIIEGSVSVWVPQTTKDQN